MLIVSITCAIENIVALFVLLKLLLVTNACEVQNNEPNDLNMKKKIN